MALINVLSPHVADLIAAGEVVEKPASVVKELMENSFDAGARSVVVDIRGGGVGSIRITDDGSGMAPEDAGVCFLRHATSKLRDERGLEAIGTLGFRGEALAAISSVSRITMTTRLRGAAQGVQMELTAGDIDSMTELGCPEGTTIVVRDLFFNTPARQKFLSSDRAEGQDCVRTALISALGRPEVSVRCLKDGEEMFFSPGDGKMDSCVYALLGRESASRFLRVNGEGDGVGVQGFASSPEYCRGNRRQQFFFVNGRPVRSAKLTAALEQAYKNAAMVGKFPECVLYLTLARGLVDVNVHPTKAEVRFSREKEVFDAVYYAVLSALQAENKLSVPVYEPKTAGTGAAGHGKSRPKKDFFKNMSAEEFRAAAPGWEKSTAAANLPGLAANTGKSGSAAPYGVSETSGGTPLPDSTGKITVMIGGSAERREISVPPECGFPAGYKPLPEGTQTRLAANTAAPLAGERSTGRNERYVSSFRAREERETQNVPAGALLVKDGGESYETAGNGTLLVHNADEEEEQSVLSEVTETPQQSSLGQEFEEEPVRFIGEALGVYILLEQGDRLILVDKHAAHERALFDRIRLGEQPLMSQELLLSVVVDADAEAMALAEENAELLENLGFAAEPFGETSLRLSAVPADIDAESAAPLFEELLEKLREGRSLSIKDVRERLAETIACKAAIKGGKASEPEELKALAVRVLNGDLKYCPHGRPVAAVFTRSELDKRFERIN